MMAATTSTATKYDPMYCLSEHLEYFNTSVAGKHELLNTDFDEIFGNGCAVPMTKLESVSSAPIEKSQSAPGVVPPSPKSVTFPMSSTQEPEPILPKPEKLDREQAVVSPTTVTSTALFSEKPDEKPKIKKIVKPKMTSRKRKVSNESAAAPAKKIASIDPDDKEDVRR